MEKNENENELFSVIPKDLHQKIVIEALKKVKDMNLPARSLDDIINHLEDKEKGIDRTKEYVDQIMNNIM